MTRVALLRPSSEQGRRSPEMRYLASQRITAVREVFEEVEEICWEGDKPELSAGTALLVLGSERVHLGAASLRAMRDALAGGAEIVLPDELAGFALAAREPVHTLRGFERLEKRILEEGDAAGTARGSHLPVAFLSARFAEHGATRLLTEPELFAEELGEAARAGVFHEYIEYYGEVREDILPFVPDDTRDVLEIGCGLGHTGEFLQQRLGCRVTGVELNPAVAREAEKVLHRVIVGNVESLDFEGKWDVVVATELFEHLNYPESFLEKMKTLLRPGGRIVLSTPNVGHYSVVEDLLAGRWDYLPIGLLCYTHFRFFTRATLEHWIARTGFEDYEIVAQTTELPERIEALPSTLPKGLEADLESLRTTGFYVILKV